MAWTAHKVKIYAKVTALGLLALFVLLFIASNTEPVKVKFLWKEIVELPTYYFMVICGTGGIVVFLVGRKVRKVIGEVKLLRQEQKAQKRLVSELSAKVNEEREKPEQNK